MSLNGVKAKVADPANFQDVLVGVRLFSKDVRYYPIYARTFVSKTVKRSADDDSRVVAIKEVCVFTLNFSFHIIFSSHVLLSFHAFRQLK